MENPQKNIAKMLETDAFSQWLGIEIEKIELGHCQIVWTLRPDMMNGFGTVHGGVLFSAADSAFAFASNSHGRLSVALDASMSFAKPARVGERLTAVANELNLGNRTGIYEVKIWNQQAELVAVFKGTVFRTDRKVIETEKK